MAIRRKSLSYYGPQPATENVDLTMYARIREEGLKHSHAMEFAGALSDGIGPATDGIAEYGQGQWVDAGHVEGGGT